MYVAGSENLYGAIICWLDNQRGSGLIHLGLDNAILVDKLWHRSLLARLAHETLAVHLERGCSLVHILLSSHWLHSLHYVVLLYYNIAS